MVPFWESLGYKHSLLFQPFGFLNWQNLGLKEYEWILYTLKTEPKIKSWKGSASVIDGRTLRMLDLLIKTWQNTKSCFQRYWPELTKNHQRFLCCLKSDAWKMVDREIWWIGGSRHFACFSSPENLPSLSDFGHNPQTFLDAPISRATFLSRRVGGWVGFKLVYIPDFFEKNW